MWTSYTSLNEAWYLEKQKPGVEIQTTASSVMASQHILLPSDEHIEVVAKRFRVQGGWSSSRVALVLEGVQGQAEVYLNGVDEAHRIGTFDGAGTRSLLVAPTRFNFDSDNVLIVHIKQSSAQNHQVFGAWREKGGMITGALKLEVLPPVSLDWQNMSVVYRGDADDADDAKDEIEVMIDVVCAQSISLKDWRVTGELLRNNEVVAVAQVEVQCEPGKTQRVSLVFHGQVDLWSMEDPVLYDVRLRMSNALETVDSVQIPLGFAVPGLAQDGHMMLNKETLDLRGMALSREEAAILKSANEVDTFLAARKEQGINMIYFIDYVDEYWLNAADRIGMSCWCELPVMMTASDYLPEEEAVDLMLRVGERHPSLLAWTVLKGGEPGYEKTVSYLDAVERLAAPRPVFELAYYVKSSVSNFDRRLLVAEGQVLQGAWGEIVAQEEAEAQSWPFEAAAALACCLVLICLEVMGFRSRGIPYAYLMSAGRLKRWADVTCGMRFWTFAFGMSVLAGLCVHAFLLMPTAASPWLGYPWDFLAPLQDVSPYLLWVTLSVLFIVLRLMQLGLASSGFVHLPEALRLVCWLEQICGWRSLVALGWVFVSLGGPWWLAIVCYIGVVFIALPKRLKTYHRIKAKIRFLWFLPVGIAGAAVVFLLVHSKEVAYFWKVWG